MSCYIFSISNGKSVLAILDFPAFWSCLHMQLDPTVRTYDNLMHGEENAVLGNKSECHKYHTCNPAVHSHDGSKNRL